MRENRELQDDQYILEKRAFEMFLTGVGVSSGLSVILALLQAGSACQLFLYSLMSVSSFSLRLYVGRWENYRPAAVFFTILMEFVLLPAAFVLEGGIFGPMPVWISVNLMFLFLFFSGKRLYILLGSVILEYACLFSRIYHNPYFMPVPTSKNKILVDFMFCFLAAVFWLGLVLFAQRKAFEKEDLRIDRYNEIIKEAGTERNRFFSDIAFEMRTPVNSILGMTELLLKEEPDYMLHTEFMGIRSASYDILSVIDDALIFSGLEAGSIIPDNRAYTFEHLLQSIIDSVSEETTDRNITFLVVANPRIPRQLLGDSRRIGQIFTHLLAASLTLTKEGRIMLRIDFEKEQDSDEAVFFCSVSDTGKGLPAAEGRNPFETFPPEGNSDSAELKLCVSREYLRLLGGAMEVKVLENVGMTTFFTFKNRILDASPMTQVKKRPAPRALVYEGEDFRMDNWRFVMEGLGVKTCYVHSRHRLENEIRDTRYDVIFLSKREYKEVTSILAFYHCEENTCIIAEPCDKYGDFGKCMMIRRPLTCISLGKVLNGEWKKEDYLVACNQENFSARGSRILVIDDNTVNLKVAAGIFSRYEVDIDIAANGEEGLNKMKREKYDLVLVDLLMPEMDGEEVLAHIRELPGEHYKNVPVIGVSSNTEEDMREYVLKKGFQGFLAKPVKGKNIEECMLQFLPEARIVYREKKKPESHKEEFVQEERGLQVSKGLANIGYNEDAYAAILNTYYRENLKKLAGLQELFKKEELSVFVSAVHGIKSTSASIGAMGLSSFARKLEYAGKDNDLGLISEKLPLFLKEYQLILEEIKAYLTEKGKMEGTVVTKPQTEERPLPEESVRQLKEKMDRMDLKACSEILEALGAANYGESNNRTILRLKEAYDRFDFHSAKKELQSLLAGFENAKPSEEGLRKV